MGGREGDDERYTMLGESGSRSASFSIVHSGDLEVGMSVLEVCMMQTAIILGLGVLGLSYAFSTMGWVLGFALLGLSAAGAMYSGLWISRIVNHLTSFGASPRKYSDLGHAAFGSVGRVVIQNVQYTFLGGALVAVQLTASTALVQVASALGGTLCLWTSNVIIAVCMLPVMQVQRLREMTWTAFLGLAMIAGPVVIYLTVVGEEASAGSGASASVGFPPSSSFDGFANGITTIVFAYQGQTIFPELISQMKRPRRFPSSVAASVALMTAVYMVVGSFGYAKLGASAVYLVDYVDGLSNVDQAKIAAANGMLIVNVMVGYTINGNVMNHALRERMFPSTAAQDRASRLQWLCVTCTTLTVSFVLSNVIPSLGDLLSVLGATCGYSLTFLFPALCSLALLKLSPAARVLHRAVVGVTGVAICVGTYATVKTLADGISEDLGSIFTC